MTNLSPLVSVVIPTYNRPVYLKQAIESACQQTYSNLEIIVADDCSPESPEELVRSFNDPRIRFIRHPKNLGNGDNIAKAFQLARGKYVAPLNDDDIWESKFIEKLLSPLEKNSNLIAAFCNYHIVDDNGLINVSMTQKSDKKWRRNNLEEGIYVPFYQQGLIDKSFWASSYVVFRKEEVDWSELESIGPFWDYFLVYLLCRNGKGAYYCPDKLARYRVHAASEHKTNGRTNPEGKIRKSISSIRICKKFLADERLKLHWPYFHKHLALRYTSVGIGLIWLGQEKAARPYFRSSLRQNPFSTRTAFSMLLSYLPHSLLSILGLVVKEENLNDLNCLLGLKSISI
ncbi:MAG: glycosyltransferase [Cyanobacteria bacterium P01_F01_bin.56]